MSLPHHFTLLGLLATVVVFAVGPTVSFAAEQKLTIHDYTGRGFPPDLVEYGVKAPEASWEKLRLFTEDGKPLPCQVRPGSEKGAGVLQFVTAVPAGGTVTYVVRDTGGERAPGGVKISKEGKDLTLSSSVLAIRVPGEVEQAYSPPVEASTLPAPILAFRNGGDSWLGKSAILTQEKVKALRVKLVTSGPACAELSYEIQWAVGGYYRATIQVIDQAPIVKVREEHDMNKLDGSQFWELDLASGWKPDRAETASHHGNGGGDSEGRVVDFASLVGGQKVQYMVGDQAWGKLSHVGVFSEADSKAKPKAFPLVGVTPLRKGQWRRSNAIEVRSENANDLRLRFPMSTRYAEWPRDISSETSPFCSLEHDGALPITYGRRIWGLCLGQPSIQDAAGSRPIYQLHRIYGIIGLDRYKDFILDWPIDAKVTYPRLYPGDANGNAEGCLKALRQLCTSYFQTTCASHHVNAGNYGFAAQADAALALPNLTPETRKEIRALLALLTYVYEDGDMKSYGNGHHHGNLNMGTARFWSGPCFMSLLPDHPMFPAWRKHMAQYGEYNLATQVEPGGSYIEPGAAYQMHGFARTTNGLPGLQSAGADNVERLLKNYVAPDWRYYMNLLTPVDSRWRSRMVPGLGNSQPGNTEHFIEAAGCLAKHDSQLAANLAWAYQANGARGGANGALAVAAPKPEEPKLTSQIYPGMGVIFRAHQGPQETYMLFRCGFQWSHWTVDPGHIVLMSKGAVLVPYQSFQYYDSADPTFDLYNSIRFGHPENDWPHGWGDSVVLDHAFGASVDYAWGSTGFPDWFIKPGFSPKWKNTTGVMVAGERKLDATPDQIQGAFEWNRQILFLKGKTAASPNYFVIRDTMPGDGKLAAYLYLGLLGTKKDVAAQGGRIAVETEWPTKLDVLFAQPKTVAPDMNEQKLPMAIHNANANDRIKPQDSASPNWIDKKDGKPWNGPPSVGDTRENRVILRIPGAPGAGYFWVLYPRDAKEQAPTIELLAEGAMKITHLEGTDYVFLGSTPVSYEGEGVVFQGRAGAVRLDAASATLVKAGGAGKVGYKGKIIAGDGACEKSLPLAQIAAGNEKTDAPASKIELPAAVTGEQEVAPGVAKASLDGGITRYRLKGLVATPFKDAAVRLEGGPAVVEISNKSVRFVAGPGFAQLSVGNRGVRGVGPFDLTFTDTGIAGKVEGDTRSFVVTWPDGVVRPMFRMDGVRYCAGWADDHSVGKGADAPQFSVAFGVTAGAHTVELTEWTYPELPPEPGRRESGL